MHTTDTVVPATPCLLSWGALHWWYIDKLSHLAFYLLGRHSARSDEDHQAMGIQQGQYTLLWKLTSVRSHHLSQGFNPFSPPMAPMPYFKSPWTPAWIISILAKVAPCVCPTAVIMIAPRKIMLKWSQIMCPTLPISLREKSKSCHWCAEVQAQPLWTSLHYSVPTTGHLLCLPLVGLLLPQKTTS